MENVQVLSPNDSLSRVRTFGNTDDDYETYSSESEDYDEEDDSHCYEVKSFYIYQSPLCRVIPTGITNHFRNLTILIIAHTGLKTVTKDDLKVFKYLKGVFLDRNELEVLEDDLFVHNLKVEEINFSENLLKHIGHNILKPLKNLTRADFYRNPCINMGASEIVDFELLKQILKKKFGPKPKKIQLENEEIFKC